MINTEGVIMPITKSAKKALRTSRRKYLINLDAKRKLKEAIKKIDHKNINRAFSLIDKAAKKKLIHSNKAARLKTHLAKKVGSTPKTEKKKIIPTKKTAKKSKKRTVVKKNKEF